MKLEISNGDKILSMVNSGLSILVILFSNVFKPEWFNYSVIFAVALIGITVVALTIKILVQSKRISNQSKQIQELETQQELIKKDLEQKEARIALLEKLMNVPFFKKWNLLYTFMWRNAISLLSNQVSLFEIHVSRHLTGTGKLKDNHVSYIFSGECLDSVKSFRFCIAGAGNIPLEKINFQVVDLTTEKPLEYGILNNSQDANIKYVEIYFRGEMLKGDIFKIELSWQWPKTAFIKSDYFSIPNIYSSETKRLILDLYPTTDMNLTTVETYKFGLSDKDPVKINHIYKNEEGFYHTIIDNPEKDADYITYYEQ